MNTATMPTNIRRYIPPLYISLVSFVGIVFVLIGIYDAIQSVEPFNLLLLILLTIITAVISTTASVTDDAGITYNIGSVLALASIPFYGARVAALLVALSSISLWVIKPSHQSTWKKTWPQLAFNTGMISLSGAVGGYTFLEMTTLLQAYPFWAAVVPWFATAVVFEHVNLILLFVVLKLQSDQSLKFSAFWKEEYVTSVLGVVINAVGGAIIAYALAQLGWIGVLVFFLPVMTSAYAFHNYVGRVEGYMQKLEEMVEARTSELQQLNQEKDAFLAVLTHDMKTPLTSIQLYGEILQTRPDLAIQKPHMIASILDAQENLLEIVNNILDLENLETGNAMQLDIQSLDLTEMLDLLITSMEAQASAKSIQLDYEKPGGRIHIKADRFQLNRVFANLISNALKYTPADGEVTISLQLHQAQCLVTVHDTGYGIPADEIDTIFERYRRIDKYRDKADGIGLGLSIAKAIIEAHGGEIMIESEEGIGSLFTVALSMELRESS